MKTTRLLTVAAAAALTLGLFACSDDDGADTVTCVDEEIDENTVSAFCMETDTDYISECSEVFMKDVDGCPAGEKVTCKDEETGAVMKFYGSAFEGLDEADVCD